MEDPPSEEDEDFQEDEGAHNIQIEELLEDGDSSSSYDLYLVDFSDFQFLQDATTTSGYLTESKVMQSK